jgi:hypothetical protein
MGVEDGSRQQISHFVMYADCENELSELWIIIAYQRLVGASGYLLCWACDGAISDALQTTSTPMGDGSLALTITRATRLARVGDHPDASLWSKDRLLQLQLSTPLTPTSEATLASGYAARLVFGVVADISTGRNAKRETPKRNRPKRNEAAYGIFRSGSRIIQLAPTFDRHGPPPRRGPRS